MLYALSPNVSKITWFIICIICIYLITAFVYPYVYAVKLHPTFPPSDAQTIEIGDDSELSPTEQLEKPFSVVVLGDSTAIGQGTNSVRDSFGFRYTQEVLIPMHPRISFHDLAKSGAKIKDVEQNQLSNALDLKPDLILISIGANDVIQQTNDKNYQASVQKVYNSLINQTNATIIWMNIPDFVAVPIFLFPLNYIAGARSTKLNSYLKHIVINDNRTKIINIYDGVRNEFLYEPNSYFSTDKFHPNKEGYGLWIREIRKQST